MIGIIVITGGMMSLPLYFYIKSDGDERCAGVDATAHRATKNTCKLRQ